jgi:hypothetical protein
VGSMTLWALGRRGLAEDDGAAGPGTAWVDDVTGLGMASGAHRRGLGEDNVVASSGTASRAWGRCLQGRRHHRLGLGKMAARKGARSQLGTMVWSLRGGLDDDAEAPGRTQ